MKTWKFSLLTFFAASAILLFGFSVRKFGEPQKKTKPFVPPKGCVFRTVMGEESSDLNSIYKTPENVQRSVDLGLSWIIRAQNQNGGWGAGSHGRQDILDPHAVQADPATTAMVSMALLRSGSTLNEGKYSTQLQKALEYLMKATENSDVNSYNITELTGTQIQSKLGQNIDVILTAQFFSNVLDHASHDSTLKRRIQKNLNTCVAENSACARQQWKYRWRGMGRRTYNLPLLPMHWNRHKPMVLTWMKKHWKDHAMRRRIISMQNWRYQN